MSSLKMLKVHENGKISSVSSVFFPKLPLIQSSMKMKTNSNI
jgi:hypothetical protein